MSLPRWTHTVVGHEHRDGRLEFITLDPRRETNLVMVWDEGLVELRALLSEEQQDVLRLEDAD